MKTNPDQYAFVQNGNQKGLTIREHMAIEFTKALLSNTTICTPNSDFEVIAETALMMVDRTIANLNQPNQAT